MQQTQPDEDRVLLLAATRDAEATDQVLQRAGLVFTVCDDIDELVMAAQESAGALLLTDDDFRDQQIASLLTLLAEQPSWSDIPTVVLCRTGHGSDAEDQIISSLRNVTVLEHRTSERNLISSLKAALRARERQYQMREQFNSLRASESALLKASEDLRDTNRRKDEFLAMLAHELRNPLAPIQNASEVLARKISDPQLQTMVSLVRRQVTHLTRLVDGLLDMSRITRGRIDLHREPIEMAVIVAQARETVESLIIDKGHTFLFSNSSDPLYVNVDSARLVQSVANILINAIKYTDPGGEIHVSLKRQADEAVLIVTDNGVGIAPELLPRLFDLFVQGNRSLDRSQGGLGIGLSVVKQLIGMHGGQVAAFSQGAGEGSTFEIRLPLCEVPQALRAGQIAPRFPGKRILVVDDNEDAANSLALILQLEGHNIDVVYNGKDALEHAQANSPEVILLDVGLPDMSGYDVARQLRPKLMATQIVALTGYGHAEDIRRATDAGFDAHMIKPVDFDTLTQLLGSFDPASRTGRGASKRRPPDSRSA